MIATGKILYPVEEEEWIEDEGEDEDEDGDGEEDRKLPDDASPDEYRPIPHAWDLDLGRDLNLRFIAERAPRFYDEVRSYFNRKGGYARFRDFVIHHDLEQAWYTYRNQETRKALLKWCRQHRIEVVFRK